MIEFSMCTNVANFTNPDHLYFQCKIFKYDIMYFSKFAKFYKIQSLVKLIYLIHFATSKNILGTSKHIIGVTQNYDLFMKLG